MTLTSGDVVLVDLGLPEGNEAGFARPVVVVSAQRVLDQSPSVVQVVPLTSTLRGYESEVDLQPDEHNGLSIPSTAQCQHIRAVAAARLQQPSGNVGQARLAQIRETLALLLDCG